jgi:hypothetical protein
MKFYYLQDPNGYESQLFSTKKAALDYIKGDYNRSNEHEDGYEPYFTEYDIQVLHIPQLTKKHILWALQDISMIVGSTINIPELD